MNFARKFIIHENPLGSFTCRKAGTWDILFYFPSERRHTEDFPDARKIQRLRPGMNPRTRVPVASMLTTRPPKPCDHGNEGLDSIKWEKFLDQQRNYRLSRTLHIRFSSFRKGGVTNKKRTKDKFPYQYNFEEIYRSVWLQRKTSGINIFQKETCKNRYNSKNKILRCLLQMDHSLFWRTMIIKFPLRSKFTVCTMFSGGQLYSKCLCVLVTGEAVRDGERR